MSLARCLSSLSSAASSTYFMLVGTAVALASALLPPKAAVDKTETETAAPAPVESVAPAKTAAKAEVAHTRDAQEAAIESESETESETDAESETKAEDETDSENESESESESEIRVGRRESPAPVAAVDGSLPVTNDDKEHTDSTAPFAVVKTSLAIEKNPASETETETETEADVLRALLLDAEDRAAVLAHLLARAEARIEALHTDNDQADVDYRAAMGLAHARAKAVARLETRLARAIKYTTRLEVELDAADAVVADNADQVVALERRVHELELELERQLVVRHEEVACARSNESRAQGLSSLPERKQEPVPVTPPSRSSACGSTQTLAQLKRESMKTAASDTKKITKANAKVKARGQTETADAASHMAARPRWR